MDWITDRHTNKKPSLTSISKRSKTDNNVVNIHRANHHLGSGKIVWRSIHRISIPGIILKTTQSTPPMSRHINQRNIQSEPICLHHRSTGKVIRTILHVSDKQKANTITSEIARSHPLVQRSTVDIFEHNRTPIFLHNSTNLQNHHLIPQENLYREENIFQSRTIV